MTIDNELSRIGISLPKHLLDQFDEIINYRGYSSRSEGIRDAIRSYIQHYKWMADVKGDSLLGHGSRHCYGIITLIDPVRENKRGVHRPENNEKPAHGPPGRRKWPY